MLDDSQIIEGLARKLAALNHDYDHDELVWVPYIDDAKTLIAALPELGYVRSASVRNDAEGTVEWAVQERTLRDGPFDRIDDGRRWSNRHGRPFTEEQAHEEQKMRINTLDPDPWRRVVTRTVHYGAWEPAPK